MKRLVIDPGVLLSAFISPRRSAPSLILEAILDGRIDALTCPALIAELTDVLSREKFTQHTAQSRGQTYIASIADSTTHVDDPPPADQQTADPDDDYLLALAHHQNADAIISGDKHLLDAGSNNMPVLTPRQLADHIALDDHAPAGEGGETPAHRPGRKTIPALRAAQWATMGTLEPVASIMSGLISTRNEPPRCDNDLATVRDGKAMTRSCRAAVRLAITPEHRDKLLRYAQ